MKKAVVLFFAVLCSFSMLMGVSANEKGDPTVDRVKEKIDENVKDNDEKSGAVFLEAAAFEKIVICPCRYSLEELKEVYARIDSLTRENELPELSAFGISETKNRVIVTLLHNDAAAQKRFLEWAGISDDAMFAFSEGSAP